MISQIKTTCNLIKAPGQLGDEVALHPKQDNLGFVRLNQKVVWHNTTLQHEGYPQQICVT